MERKDEGKDSAREVANGLMALLTEVLVMAARILRRIDQKEEQHMEESSLREEQYPCDEYEMMFYDEDFKFEWL
tara:strand:- start:443 stop:664 length:222 start_codon:yes stop_codon:yes gene_type:complete